MKRASLLAATAAIFFTRGAAAQPSTSSPVPDAPAPAGTTAAAPAAPAPAAPGVPSREPGQEGGATGTGAGATPNANDEPKGLLAPQFPEDFYPGMPAQNGLLEGIPISEKHNLRFALHGYFRAPFRITKVPRADGSTKEGEGDSNWRTPFLVDDDYFKSGFAYTPVNETDFTELYASVGNDKVTATIQFQGSLFSDAAKTDSTRQPGISQGWLTYRTDLKFIPWLKTKLKVKGGAFWERYGYMPKYDTYVFARTHQMGENIRLQLEKDQFTFWMLHGIGTHLEDIQSNQGLTLLNYASIGASWARTIELGLYWFDNESRDKRQLTQLTDSSMSIVGVDVRADTKYAGKVYAATSYIAADQATFQASAVEVMHSLGGRGITENYLGAQSSNNGTGSLWNVGAQYDLSLADLTKGWTGQASPLPWHGDITATLFGLYSFVQSDQKSTDPLVNRDDHKSFKWGAEGGYRITEWMSASLRYDRVVLDTTDSANSFRIISPRLAFFTSFLTREMLYLQYSRYAYNERVRLRAGQVNLETIPDDHVVKIQAQMSF